tara:strand:- start:232 stop:459 length:228 start_codon:yes stop_codon:yes gene_type:complete
MLSTSDYNVSDETLHFKNEEETFKFAKTLKVGNFATQFNLLKNWNLERNFAINIYKLTSDYFHLLNHEPFDENQN